MHFTIKEFISYSEMELFSIENKYSVFIDLDTESANRYYAIEVEDLNKSYYFTSDDVCELQVKTLYDNIFILIDNYFIIINGIEIKKIKLNAPGIAFNIMGHKIVVIYELGVLIYDLETCLGKKIYSSDLIIDYQIQSDRYIILKYDDLKTNLVDISKYTISENL